MCSINSNTQKNFWGGDRKIAKSVTGKYDFPVSGQLLIRYNRISLVLD